MKKLAILSVIVFALGAAAAYACADCPEHKGKGQAKAAEMKEKKADKKDCADCPMSKKGKMCPEAKKDAKPAAAAKEGKKCCPGTEHKDAKAGAKAPAKAGKKYMCAMKCVEADKPGKCPKCGMPMEEVKAEAKK